MASAIGLIGNHSSMERDWNSLPVRSTDRCLRCDGFMVPEWDYDLMGNTGQRCVQCGEVVDSVILQNRRLQQAGSFNLDTNSTGRNIHTGTGMVR